MPPPLSKRAIVDRYFLEHRAKVLDVAAFFDRVDRAQGEGSDDFRVRALEACCAILTDGQPERARRVLELLSDHSHEPIAEAHGKGATGACAATLDAAHAAKLAAAHAAKASR